MIAEAVRILRDELARYIVENSRDNDTIPDQDIILENIANLDSEEVELSNRVVLSLVNIQEESTLKNLPNYRANPLTGGYDYDRPPAYVNLYLLVCASPDISQNDGYEIALDRLSLVVEFFQAKNLFTVANSPLSSVSQSLASGTLSAAEALELEEIKMYVDLYSLTFEQLNHLWGSLGGKQVPNVLYKVRLTKIHSRAEMGARIIEEAASDSTPNLSN